MYTILFELWATSSHPHDAIVMWAAAEFKRGGQGGTRVDEDGTGGCTDQPPEGPRENETFNGQTEAV